jgi:aspartyl-tRNA(Asn)/glutamyl-tRNA(Gln) amidotransferase subunit C
LFFGNPQENAANKTGGDAGREEKKRMTAKVTVADVERVAELAHLKLAPEEIQPMQRDLNAILDYVAELNELDTTGIEPLAQASELMAEQGSAARSGLRADRLEASLARSAVMPQAPETDGAFFKVPKVIER